MLNISSFPWAECSITETRDLYIADSVGMKRFKRSTGIHRYDFELVTHDMKMKVGRGVMAKLSKAVDDTLLYVHPRLSFSQGTEPAGGILVNGAQAVGSDAISLYSTLPWQIKAGDYLQFSNDNKVYQAGDDTLLTSGIQTVNLTSSIRNPLVADSTVTVNNVTWYLSSDGVIQVDMLASDDQDMQITLTAVEQL